MQVIHDLKKEAQGMSATMLGAKLQLQWVEENAIRVVYTKTDNIPGPGSDVIVKDKFDNVEFEMVDDGRDIHLKTAKLQVSLSKQHGTLHYRDPQGNTLLKEAKIMRITRIKDYGECFYRGSLHFETHSEEAIHGLGQFTHGHMDQKQSWQSGDEPLVLKQTNTQIAIPMMLSTRGWGMLFNTYSQIEISSPMTVENEWLHEDAIDYYFIFGPEYDRIIAGYRDLTGHAPLLPRWSYGFWQSRCVYPTQSELMGIARQYRKKKLPLDALVIDYFHWRKSCGSFEFDEVQWPDPEGMIKTLHEADIRIMVSIWPSFEAGNDNFRTLKEMGALLDHRSDTFLGHFYDVTNPEARKCLWEMVKKSYYALGVDAFWLDACEPEDENHTGWGEKGVSTSVGPMAKVLNTYSLLHTSAYYEGQRQESSAKRVYLLVRSAYAGQQRHAAVAWSGDIDQQFSTLKAQIPAGLNFCAAGVPYWASDIGGFSGGVWSIECIIRWFQYGIFCPIFRLHGNRANNELWSYGEQAEKILTRFTHLRYRLLPYIYSLAHKITSAGYTLMRALAFDFPHDKRLKDIDDQFMFGPALLVNPVTEAGADNRRLSLPDGSDWYDFWTGARMPGGGSKLANAPIDTLPLYVRAGSIIPLGPIVESAGKVPLTTVELRVYRGADGHFDLYEDDGDGYDYEKGAYSTVPIDWNEEAMTLTLGERQGQCPSTPSEIIFNITWVSDYKGVNIEELPAEDIDTSVVYTGEKKEIKV